MTSLGTATATTMSTKLSQTWFSEKERPISTALIGLSPVLGGLSGQALSPLVMNDNPDNLPILNIVTKPVRVIIKFIAEFPHKYCRMIFKLIYVPSVTVFI